MTEAVSEFYDVEQLASMGFVVEGVYPDVNSVRMDINGGMTDVPVTPEVRFGEPENTGEIIVTILRPPMPVFMELRKQLSF